ncbi:protein-lysine N-methyltransferase EEF2KMT isoform X1 [Cucumis sativus]|uniref:protein-lysine N-methyltransferase EEF2KMT isoform X1 n=1 Tax=Cucumis sativus TaxID=3659 RepID=UPI0012F4B269|nr:protein-lysine N-methyltransferase EEF2KMT isoform X1 [Cucumis sativus]
MAEELRIDVSLPPGLHFLSAFLSMEPADSLLSIARDLGRGLVTEAVQKFIWDHCITKAQEMNHFHVPYLKNFLKKLISEVELSQAEVLDEFYELYAHYMVSWKDENLRKESAKISKFVSFLFPDGSLSCQNFGKFVVPIQCSLNMLEGDTGCSIWPSSLYLSELILSFPDIFSTRECFEVGSGVGLVGICLAHVKASKIVLSDGDPSTLANMKVNLELNGLCCLSSPTATSERTNECTQTVECIHLPWESTSETELQAFAPHIVLGADVIYDPICLPDLVRVLSILLRPKQIGSSTHSFPVTEHVDDQRNDGSRGFKTSRDHPIAYIASVIRNIDTFNRFLSLVEQANLSMCDVTDELKPMNLLPYMYTYNRSSIRLFTLKFK